MRGLRNIPSLSFPILIHRLFLPLTRHTEGMMTTLNAGIIPSVWRAMSPHRRNDVFLMIFMIFHDFSSMLHTIFMILAKNRV